MQYSVAVDLKAILSFMLIQNALRLKVSQNKINVGKYIRKRCTHLSVNN